jgi:hypothetical protein
LTCIYFAPARKQAGKKEAKKRDASGGSYGQIVEFALLSPSVVAKKSSRAGSAVGMVHAKKNDAKRVHGQDSNPGAQHRQSPRTDCRDHSDRIDAHVPRAKLIL